MKHTDYVSTNLWFAFLPVRTEDKKWVWLRWVKRTVDDRPLVYLGLLTEYTYETLKFK